MSSLSAVIDGSWKMVNAELAGEAAPELVVAQSTMELAGGTYTMRFGGEIVDRGTFEVGAVVDLHPLVLHGTKGPKAGRTIPCVYQLRGDRLRVCFGLDGIAPTEFSTAAEERRYLATYRRTDSAPA